MLILVKEVSSALLEQPRGEIECAENPAFLHSHFSEESCILRMQSSAWRGRN